MFKTPPKEFLNSAYRRNQWKKAIKVLKTLEKIVSISEAYIVGSFTTQKKSPADIDFILFLKTKEQNKGSKWAFDLTIAPDNDYGRSTLKETEKWVENKYKLKKSPTIRIK